MGAAASSAEQLTRGSWGKPKEKVQIQLIHHSLATSPTPTSSSYFYAAPSAKDVPGKLMKYEHALGEEHEQREGGWGLK